MVFKYRCYQNYFLILILLLCITITPSLSNSLSSENEKIEVRKPTKEKIESLKEQRDFAYARKLKPAESLWDRLMFWLGYQLDKLLAKTSYNYFWKPLFYLIIIATIIFVILKLFGVEIRNLFSKTPATVEIPFDIINENIHELNLDQLIAQATELKNFRLAVRYLYLKVLKQLSDSELIVWKTGKTNRMYVVELNKNQLHQPFEYLTTQFEYVWYGEFEMNDKTYENVRSKFVEFGKVILN